MGRRKLNTFCSPESVAYINDNIKKDGPTLSVKQLCAMIVPDMPLYLFPATFYLTSMQCFLYPNASQTQSSYYFDGILVLKELSEFDLCSVVLDWLVSSIPKFQLSKPDGRIIVAGGCSPALVFSYFEFIITSEFKLGMTVSRLCLWTTNVVKSYIALDSLPSSNLEFGRLPLMHVSATPFKATVVHNSEIYKLPKAVLKYLDEKFPPGHRVQDKLNIQALAQNFFQKVVESSVLTVNAYIDDIIPAVFPKLRDGDMTTKNDRMQSKFDKIFTQLPVPCIIDETSLGNSDIMGNLIQKMSDAFSISEEMSMSVPDMPDCMKELMNPKVLELPSGYNTLSSVSSSCNTNLSFNEDFQGYIFQKEENSLAECDRNIILQKFSMSSLKFYYPDGRAEELDEDAYAVLPNTNEHSQPQLIQQMTTRSNMKQQFNSGASSKTWGLSLNERILGANSNPCNADKYGPEPSFNLFGEETPGSSNKTNSSAARTNSFSSQMGTVSTHTSPDCVGGFRTISPTHQNKSNSAQLIFSTAYENQFYNLTKSFAGKLESSPRIFQVESRWVDQRTLTLSMISGGWLHKRVMDCFTELLLVEQFVRVESGEFHKNEVLKYIVDTDFSSLLMDPLLNHFEHKDCFREASVGFRLENAGFVHIPCIVPTQHMQAVWFLIVANFIDKYFDVLNPNNETDTLLPLINAACYNFKILFLESFPHCPYFNIRDFNIRHIEVPKVDSRVDSGIFVLKFMTTFDGFEVQKFSKDDVQPIREKSLCHLLLSRHNSIKLPFIRKFIQTFSPHVLI